MFLNVQRQKSMTSVGESETGGWISSFQSRMAGHTVLEDGRNYRDETTEWKLLTRCLPRGAGECLFFSLCRQAANIFRARAGGFQSADTRGSWRPAGSTPASRLPQQMLPLSAVLCSRSRLLTQATHGIKKSSPSYQSRTQYTSKTRRENTTPPPSFGWTNREISAQFVQPLLLLILCKQSQLAGTCSLARTSPPECVNFVLNASVQFWIHTCAVYLFLRNK